MNGTYGKRNQWADKIAFFSLFIAVLLIAWFIVFSRSATVLSEPIELDFAVLSVRIPTGNGWQSEKQWIYQRNAFILDSFFNASSGRITAVVSCRYLLAAVKASPNELFEEKTSAMSRSRIVKTGRIEIGGSDTLAALNWAHIENLSGSKQKTTTLFDTFFGVAQLPNNRRLDIEVYETTGDLDLAERIFSSVVDSIKFTDNHLLKAGGKIVTEIKDKGLDSFLASAANRPEQDRDSFFLIEDAAGRSLGFTMEAMSRLKPERFMAISYYYIQGRRDREQAAFFQSGNNLNEFVWKSQTSGLGGKSSAEIILGKDRIMTVKKFGRWAEEKTYQISPAATPDVLVEFILGQMLDSNDKKILVDIIEADGKIAPALVSRIDAQSPAALQSQNSEADAATEETAYIFKMEILDGRGFSEQVYLDSKKQISRRLLQQENTYTLERTDKENILREFPEQGIRLLERKDKILEQNQLQESGEQ